MRDNYQIIRIQQYLEGLLSKEEMYDMEREALGDPFLSDALEGYRLQAEVNHGKLSLLQQRLAARIEDKYEEKNRFYFTSQRLAIASVAAVLFVLAVVLLWMKATMVSEGDGVVLDAQSGVSEMLSPEFHEDLEMRIQQAWEVPAVRETMSSVAAPQTYRLYFDIDAQGVPYNLDARTAEGEAASPVLENEWRKVLEEGPLWQGMEGQKVELDVRWNGLPPGVPEP